ncbi:hypothetical protein LS73_001320 [Helicobacter muridarum]|uniref:Membrane protein n=1 Tax=Helicobacter muridarum TaxID=216 RepID=A0A099TYV1_9HELI|nr:hypothetical protein [Helicobacter muridarum]TLE01351.1 hypothetical protein LS73_001320 [Helicobacter muridarum]STQ85276.1 membrane protein [Helicobacter muridarum]
MKYSFTKPISKHIFKLATKVWVFYFIVAFGILMYFRVILILQIEDLKEDQELMRVEQEHIKRSTEALAKEGERMYYELDVITQVKNQDEKLRQQIGNILNMIPAQVAISEIRFDNDRLFMRGLTSSKEIFETSLQSQLRAVYSKSESNFYELPSGWYNFESVSQTMEGDGLLQRTSN